MLRIHPSLRPAALARVALAAAVLWASLPAAVCEALCAAPEPPPCHAQAGPEAPPADHDDCERCEADQGLVAAQAQPVSHAASPAPAQSADAFQYVAHALRTRAPRGPPGIVHTPWAQANPPLLS